MTFKNVPSKDRSKNITEHLYSDLYQATKT